MSAGKWIKIKVATATSYARLAQRTEWLPSKQLVRGSNPLSRAKSKYGVVGT